MKHFITKAMIENNVLKATFIDNHILGSDLRLVGCMV